MDFRYFNLVTTNLVSNLVTISLSNFCYYDKLKKNYDNLKSWKSLMALQAGILNGSRTSEVRTSLTY